MNISSLINKSIYGVNFMSNWMQTFDTYVGVIVFFFLISYNTRLSKEEYAQGKADHLGISMRFLYDFLTFIRATIFKLFKPSGKKWYNSFKSCKSTESYQNSAVVPLVVSRRPKTDRPKR